MRTCIRVMFVAVIACGLVLAQKVSISDKPVPVDGKAQQPKLVKMVRPQYPAEAKSAGVQGSVVLRTTIAKDGTAKLVEAVSGDEVLKSAAVEAVKQWQWEPVKMDGKAVEVITDITVNFRLDDGEKK